jgi:general L-amino acid transport system substrate-binding protein
MKTIKFLIALFIVFGLAVLAFADGDGIKPKGKLKEVLRRGELNCGVRSGTVQNIPGDPFSDSSSQKIGELYCRGLAAALDVDVNIIKLTVPDTFEALHANTVDVTFRTMSERLGRDVVDLVNMGEVMFYNTYVAKTSEERCPGYPFDGSVAEQVEYIQNNEKLVCVRAGQVQESIAREAGLGDDNLYLTDEDYQDYLDGCCEVNMNSSALHIQITDPAAATPWSITALSVMTSQEHSNSQWDDLLKYYMGGLRAAVRFDIDKENVLVKKADPALISDAKALLGITTNCRGETAGDLVGLDADWIVRAIQEVGNYYEIYEASLGHPSLADLDRVNDDAGLNQVYIDASGRTNGALVDHLHNPAFTETSFATCD